MWIFTTSGFVSAVQDWNDPSRLLVRARDRASLEQLATVASATIERTPTADYPYRCSVSKQQFEAWAAEQARTIDYPNFKSQVAISRDPHYAHSLMDVWEAMHQVEVEDARKPLAPAGRAPLAEHTDEIAPFVIRRIQTPYVPDACIVPGSTAVVSFGNPTTSRVATLGINASADEFTLGPDGNLKPSGHARRLLTLADFQCDSPHELSDDAAAQIARRCYDYFLNENTHSWFEDLETYVLQSVGASYHPRSGAAVTACHLDIVQWSTAPAWANVGKVAPHAPQLLIDADARFLEQQLAEHDFDWLFVNGRTATALVKTLRGVSLRPVGKTPWGSQGKASMLWRGSVRGTRILAWNLNLQRHETTPDNKRHLATWVESQYMSVGD